MRAGVRPHPQMALVSPVASRPLFGAPWGAPWCRTLLSRLQAYSLEGSPVAPFNKSGVPNQQTAGVPSRGPAPGFIDPDSTKLLKIRFSPGGIATFLTKKETPMTTDPPVNSHVQIKLSDDDHDRMTVLIHTIFGHFGSYLL